MQHEILSLPVAISMTRSGDRQRFKWNFRTRSSAPSKRMSPTPDGISPRHGRPLRSCDAVRLTVVRFRHQVDRSAHSATDSVSQCKADSALVGTAQNRHAARCANRCHALRRTILSAIATATFYATPVPASRSLALHSPPEYVVQRPIKTSTT